MYFATPKNYARCQLLTFLLLIDIYQTGGVNTSFAKDRPVVLGKLLQDNFGVSAVIGQNYCNHEMLS